MADNYQLQALFFASVVHHESDVVACVHLENNDDKMFWEFMLQNQRAGRYYFITNSRSNKGHKTSGSKQCLNYLPYLSKEFFISIDSDLRYLLQEPHLDADHFVCQTYTYSWENHYCEANALQSRFEAQCPGRAALFDFEDFLTSYSKVIFKPTLLLLYCLKNHRTEFTRHQFNACLPYQCKGEEQVNNGTIIVEKMAQAFEPYLNTPFAKNVDLEAEAAYCKQLGITEENAYLHVRGHNLMDLVCYIGEMTCRGTGVSFKNDILMKSLLPYNYWQIEKIASDITQIMNV